MDRQVNEKMESALLSLLGALEQAKPETVEYKEIVARIDTLTKNVNEREKTMIDIDKNKKEKYQYIVNKVLDAAKLGVEVAGIIAPLVFYKKWMILGFKYEEEGSITSQTFKHLIGKFKPYK